MKSENLSSHALDAVREGSYGSLSLRDITSTAATWAINMPPDRPKSPSSPLLSVLQRFISYDTALSVQNAGHVCSVGTDTPVYEGYVTVGQRLNVNGEALRTAYLYLLPP